MMTMIMSCPPAGAARLLPTAALISYGPASLWDLWGLWIEDKVMSAGALSWVGVGIFEEALCACNGQGESAGVLGRGSVGGRFRSVGKMTAAEPLTTEGEEARTTHDEATTRSVRLNLAAVIPHLGMRLTRLPAF